MVAVTARPARIARTRPSKLWWLLGAIVLSVCLVVQLPARWLVAKFAPNTPYLQQVSGNLWHGQANWQLMTSPTTPLAGTATWQWLPWQLFLGKIGMDVQLQSGKTLLNGQVRINHDSWQVLEMNGKIAPETLRQLVSWQLPDVPLVVKDLGLRRTGKIFSDAKGNLTWSGGELGYPMAGKMYRLTMPATVGTLSLSNNAGQSSPTPTNTPTPNNGTATPTGNANAQKLHLALTNAQAQRLGDLYLDTDNMLDVALTQRLLKNMPDYKGQGVDDTVVVTLRQPLASVTK